MVKRSEETGKDEKYLVGIFSGLGPGGACGVIDLPPRSQLLGVSEQLTLQRKGRKNFERYVNAKYFGSWIQEHTGTILPEVYPKNPRL